MAQQGQCAEVARADPPGQSSQAHHQVSTREDCRAPEAHPPASAKLLLPGDEGNDAARQHLSRQPLQKHAAWLRVLGRPTHQVAQDRHAEQRKHQVDEDRPAGSGTVIPPRRDDCPPQPAAVQALAQRLHQQHRPEQVSDLHGEHASDYRDYEDAVGRVAKALHHGRREQALARQIPESQHRRQTESVGQQFDWSNIHREHQPDTSSQ